MAQQEDLFGGALPEKREDKFEQGALDSNRDSLNLDEYEQVDANQFQSSAFPSNFPEAGKVVKDIGSADQHTMSDLQTKDHFGVDGVSQYIGFDDHATVGIQGTIEDSGDHSKDLLASSEPFKPIQSEGIHGIQSDMNEFTNTSGVVSHDVGSDSSKVDRPEVIDSKNVAESGHSFQPGTIEGNSVTDDLLGSFAQPPQNDHTQLDDFQSTNFPPSNLLDNTNPAFDDSCMTGFTNKPVDVSEQSFGGVDVTQHREPSPVIEPTFQHTEPVMTFREPTPPLREPSPVRELSPAPREPSPAPREPSPAPRESSPAPREPSPAPREPSPAPREPSPAPRELSPAPRETSPAPREPSPAPREPTPPPRQPTPPPREPTPPPRQPTPPPREPTPPPRKPTPPPREPTPPPREPTPPPREPTPLPREPTPPPREPPVQLISPPVQATPLAQKPSIPPTEERVTKGKSYPLDVSTRAKLAVFDPLAELIYWRDLKKSGAVLTSILVLLLSLVFFSLISVLAYTALTVLLAAVGFRIYKNIKQAVQKTQDGHPFKEYLAVNPALPADNVHGAVDVMLGQINSTLAYLHRIFLVEDLIDSCKFGCYLWVLTYIGAWVNGLTLIILAVVALFSLPKAYEQNKAQVDQYMGLAQQQVNQVLEKVKAVLPIGGNKEKDQ